MESASSSRYNVHFADCCHISYGLLAEDEGLTLDSVPNSSALVAMTLSEDEDLSSKKDPERHFHDELENSTLSVPQSVSGAEHLAA